MPTPTILPRQGRRLLQIGVVMLLFVSFEGFAIPHLMSPELGRSVHTLSALFAVLLLAFGLAWPQLALGVVSARAAFWLLVYSGVAIVAAFVFAAAWGAGETVMPIAAMGALGSDAQETTIRIVAYSSAPTGIVAFALILWGLRGPPR